MWIEGLFFDWEFKADFRELLKREKEQAILNESPCGKPQGI